MSRQKAPILDFIINSSGFTPDIPSGISDPTVSVLASKFAEDRYSALYDISFRDAQSWYPPSLAYLHKVGSAFVKALILTPDLETLRDSVVIDVDPSDLRRIAAGVPFIQGSEFVNTEWVASIWANLLDVYRREISAFDGKVELYIGGKNRDLKVPGRIFFHLVEDRKNAAFAFMATYSTESDGGITHKPLANALKEYSKDTKRMLSLLSCLNEVAGRSPFISSMMESGELFHPLRFSPQDAYTFLREVPVYEDSGVICRIPNWWRSRSGVSVNRVVGDKPPSQFDAKALLSVRPSLIIDGQEISAEEARSLLEAGSSMALIKGKWVEVDADRLRKALEMFESIEGSEAMTVAEAMTASLKDVDGSITNGEWMESMLTRLKEADLPDVELPESFKGVLRPYQRRGLNWLGQMDMLGFGACLADDMGLGKTVQVIAFLEHRRAAGDNRCILVVPASLLGNWRKEIERFAPDMPFRIVHSDSGGDEVPFLTVTTYGMVKTRPELSEIEWDSVIADEAQAIKNPSTQQTKAVKALKGRFKLAMTGTPVENSLGDLWSIFDFTNTGLLGTGKEFTGFTKGMSEDPSGFQRLREMTAPFILRRLKTDKRIIDDLPDKSEIDTFVELSKKQTLLYNDYLDRFRSALEGSEGGDRRGLVLAAITKFKQICDHPSLYTGDGSFAAKDSGKYARLAEIAENVKGNGERMLVFTQYKEMTKPLSEFLEGVFGRRGLVLHGGTPVKKRAEMVERFNSDSEYIPFMVMSLKAGGVGLNLTAANHVVHFDRWWNPAVENQATDRAFRIGQRKDVMVYRFVCIDTVEEKVAAMIEGKRDLAERIVDSGEGWIADMSNEQLIELFRMG